MRSSLISAGAVFVLMAGFVHAPLFHFHELEEAGHAQAGTVHAHLPEPAGIPEGNSIDEFDSENFERSIHIIIVASAPQPELAANLNRVPALIAPTPISEGVRCTNPIRTHDPPVIDNSNPRSPPA